MKTYLFLLIILCVACSKAPSNHSRNLTPIKVGDHVELDFYELTALNGEIQNDKAILVDFWATWCGPCIAAFPHLEEVQQKYKNKLQIVAVTDEAPSKVQSFVDKKAYQLDFFINPDSTLFKRFHITSRPTSALVSKEGTLLWVGSSSDLDKTLEVYFETNQISSPQITELNKTYYQEGVSSKQQSLLYLNLNQSFDEDAYYVKNQKNNSDIVDIKYVGVPISEVVSEFLAAPHLNFINDKRIELDTILIDIEAKSNHSLMTYGFVKNTILEQLKTIYSFDITTYKKPTLVYELKIENKSLLATNLETTDGGGFVKRDHGTHIITRLSLNNLASYLTNKTKQPIAFEANHTSKYSFKIPPFNSIEDLEKHLQSLGLSLTKTQQIQTYYKII